MPKKPGPSGGSMKREAPKRTKPPSPTRIPRYYREIVKRSPHGVCVFYRNLFVHANEAWLRLYRVASLDDVIGQPPWAFVAPPDMKRAKAYADAREKGEPAPVAYDALARRADGTTFPVHLTVSMIPWGKEAAKLVFFEDVSERAEAEERLRWLSRLAEQAGEGVAVANLEGTLTFVNRAWAQMHGYEPAELVGQHLSISHSPEQLVRDVLPFNEQVLQNGRHTGEVGHIRRDGTPFPTEMTTTLQLDKNGKVIGLIGFARDVTERKRAEQALRESEERFRILTETTSAAIMIYRGPKLVYVNPAWESLTGFTREEACSRAFAEFVHPDHREMVRERALARQRGEAVTSRYEFKVVTRSGEERWADICAGVIRTQGEVCGLATAFDVTDRKRAEDALRERETLYRLILDNVEEIIWSVDLSQDPLHSPAYFMSPQIESIIGYTPEEFYSDPSIWIEKIVHPEDRERVRSETRRCIDSRETVLREYRMRHKVTGEYHWVEDHVVPIPDDRGIVTRIQGVARDITERRRTQDAIEKRNRQLLSVLASSRAMTGFSDLKEAVRAICKAAVEAFDLRMVWIGLVVPESTEVKVIGSHGYDEGYTDYVRVRWDETSRAQGPVGRSIKSRRPVVSFTDEPDFAPWREEALKRGYKSCCSIPMVHDEAVRGAIVYYSGARQTFDETTVDLLGIFAQHATMVVVNAALYDEARCTVEELSEALGALQKSRDALREREELYRGIYHTAPLAMVLWDRSCAVTDWNTQAEKLFGWSREEVLGRNFFDFLIPEADKPLVEEVVRMLMEGRLPSHAINENLTRDGRTILCEWNNAILRDDRGDILGAISLGLDITERARSEAALKESEERYRGLVENARGILLLFTPDLKVTYWNDYAEEFFGFGKEEILGSSLMDTIVPRTEATGRDLEDLLRRIASDPNAFASNINENVTKDGRKVWVAWTNRPVLDAQGRVVVVLSHGTDITHLKRAEAGLRESEKRYRDLVDASPDAISIVGLDGTIQMVNRRTLSMGGRSAEELVGHNALEFVPPTDRQLIEQLMSETLEKGTAHAAPCAFTRKDGSIFPTEVHVSLMKDNRGAPRAFIAEVRDISQQVHSQEALMRSEHLYRTLAESSTDWIFIIGTDGRVQYVNPAAEERLGARPQGIVGRPLRELFPAEVHDAMWSNVRGVLQSGDVYSAVDRFTFPGGAEVVMDTQLVPMKEADGTLKGVMGIVRDITGREDR